MMTFKQFSGKLKTIPASTTWYLADLGEARAVQRGHMDGKDGHGLARTGEGMQNRPC